YRVRGGRLEALPPGSTLDPTTATFAWQLGPGFAGVYDLLFVKGSGEARERLPVRIVIEPHASAQLPALAIREAVTVEGGTLALTGVATAGDARQIRDVRVYAVPTNGGAEQLVGQTTVG